MSTFDEKTNTFLNTQRATQNLTEKSYENNISNVSTSDTNGLLQTSTNIFIRANNTNVGMIQSFSISESRTVTKLQSIGVEGVIQAAPQNTNGGTISATRVAIYGERLYDAFKFKSADDKSIFNTLKDQRIPFEIQVLTVSGTKTGSDGSSTATYYTETYVDCWLTSYKKSYTVSNITVSEEVSMIYADVI